MSYMLALDQSTSATKAVLFDARGGVVDRAAREHQQLYPAPGWVEHDAEAIWQNTLAVIAEVVRRRPAEARAAAGLAIANQRETFVVFDRRTGRPLHNAVVWQCRRGDAVCRSMAAEGCEPLVRRKTGLRLDAYFTGSKLKWLLDQEPALRAKIDSGDALFGTVDAYLVYRLTRGEVYAGDATNASRTLLYDIGKLAWDAELCDLFSMPLRRLPEVRESSARFGSTDAGGALDAPIPICGVMGDSQASLFSHGCFHPGMAKVTLGSGSSVLLNVGGALPEAGADAVIALAWLLAGKPTYALEGLINFSAATIAWLKNQLGLITDVNEAERLAAAVDDNGGVYLVPAFAGLGAPHYSAAARAAIVGLSAHSTRNHVVRAALESIGYQIHDVLEMMRHDAGVAPHVVHADGGPTRNEWLMQFIADVAQVELAAAEHPDASAWGAAMVGMIGLGVHRSFSDLESLPVHRKYVPPENLADRRRPPVGRLVGGRPTSAVES